MKKNRLLFFEYILRDEVRNSPIKGQHARMINITELSVELYYLSKVRYIKGLSEVSKLKAFGLLILVVGFAFPVLGQGQSLICGQLLDRKFIQGHCQGENPREEECGLRINDEQRFAPWFELLEKVGEEDFDITFVDGLLKLFGFDSERAELVELDIARFFLNIKMSVFSERHERVVLLDMNLSHRPARELDGDFYQGIMKIVYNYEFLQKSPSPRNQATEMAAEVYPMPFACVTNP